MVQFMFTVGIYHDRKGVYFGEDFFILLSFNSCTCLCLRRAREKTTFKCSSSRVGN